MFGRSEVIVELLCGSGWHGLSAAIRSGIRFRYVSGQWLFSLVHLERHMVVTYVACGLPLVLSLFDGKCPLAVQEIVL